MSPYPTLADNLHRSFRKAPRKGDGASPAFVEYLSLIYTAEEAELLQHVGNDPSFLTTRQISDKSRSTEAEVEKTLSRVHGKNGITRMGNAWALPPITLIVNLAAGLSQGKDEPEAGNKTPP